MLKLGLKSQTRHLLAPCSKRQFSQSIIQLNKSSISSDLDKELEELANLKLSTTPLPEVDEAKESKYNLINTFNKYEPKTLTEETVLPGMGRPMPINTELNYYAPLKHEVKYGHLKAELNFRCFDPQNLDFFCDFALRVAYYLGLPATGPKPLPVKRERWTVNRAPFVHAKSKENFERKTYSRLIRIWDANPEVIDVMLSFISKNSVWGVGVKCHMYTQEPLGMSKGMKTLEKGEATVLSDLSSTLDSLSRETNSEVAQKVLSLLNDPIFTKHMTSKEIAEVKAKTINS